MTNYATSEDYTAYLSGKEAVINTASFDFYSRKATKLISQMTFDRLIEIDIPEEVKLCCCEVAESIFKQDQKSADITSEKVGNYSVSRNVMSASDYDASRRAIIKNWLADTGLIYKGV